MVISALAENLGRLKEAAETLGHTLLIIDTGPSTDAGALAAIRAADLIIAPVMPNFFDIGALKSTDRLIEKAGKLDRAVCVVNGLHYQGTEQDYQDAKGQVEAIGHQGCAGLLRTPPRLSARSERRQGRHRIHPEGCKSRRRDTRCGRP
jgi:MinD-like ATPase involved in chromosome partitioning or flagellar assembly